MTGTRDNVNNQPSTAKSQRLTCHSPPLIHTFGLRNSLRLQSLARRSVPLSLEHYFMEASVSFWAAVSSPLPWHGAGAATYLHVPANDSPPLRGFIQAVKRFARPEADLTRIAPAHDAAPLAPAVWQRLLERIIAEAGEHGIHRLYACLPNREAEALATLAAAGFVPYIQETLFRHEPLPLPPAGDAANWPHVRPQREADSFALLRLHSRHTPPLVQQAEGALSSSDESPSPLDLRRWWQPEHNEGFVYEEKGDILAAAQLSRGRNVHWLRLLGDPIATAPQSELLACSLHALAHYSPRPILSPIRPYQTGLGAPLVDFGFAPDITFTHLVRYTTSPVRKTVPARDMVEAVLPALRPSEAPNLTPYP